MSKSFDCIVAFTDGGVGRWWARFMKKGYKHCFVMYPLELHGEQCTVLLEPSLNYLKTVVFTNTAEEVTRDYCMTNSRIKEVIYCQVDNICLNKYSIEVRTCVTIIKLILGKRWWWIQTPWQLRNKILKSDLVKR